MAMFSTPKRDGDLPVALRPGSHDARLSVLAAGIRVIGQIETEGVVKIEGEVEGSVRAEGQVLVAKGGVVKGDIYTRQAVVAGEVHGGILAEERVELQASSVIDGDITAPRIVVEEGGQVNGHLKMAAPDAVHRQVGRTPERNRPESPTASGSPSAFTISDSGPKKVSAGRPN